MADDSSATALAVVVSQCLADAAISPSSGSRIGPTLFAFVGYLESLGIASVDEVTPGVAGDFVRSRLQSGRSPSLATQYNRRTSLRMLFAAARQMGLAAGDPTLDLWLPSAGSIKTRPLTDDEIERCRDVAQWSSAQVAAAWALAEATARGAEIALVTAASVDLASATVELPGGPRSEPRTGELSAWGVAALGRRLGDHTEGHAVAFTGASRAAGQASTCRSISSVLIRAGVGGQPAVRPSSVAGWAGRRVFERTGRIEEAARAMGVRSLDRAARLIGLDWPSDA